MELVYLWVEDYKNIHKQGFNFSPRFECEFKDEYDEDEKLKDNCELIIKPKEHLEDFFGKNINVTAIVGENGSGKSSVLRNIIGYSRKNGTFIVYKDNNKIFIYQEKITETIHTNIETIKECNFDFFSLDYDLLVPTFRDNPLNYIYAENSLPNNGLGFLYDFETNTTINLVEYKNKIDDLIKKYISDDTTSISFLKKIFQQQNNMKEFKKWSSGERHFLTNLLLIYDAILKYKNDNILINLDEIDLTLHPNWQKKYIKILIQMLATFQNKKFHLIVTSHSPFILSDFPKENVIFLKKGEQVDAGINPLGANIHTLLSHGFFMQDGLMGEFAKNKINKIIDFLNDKRKIEDISTPMSQIKKVIDSIGEPFLQAKLEQMYQDKFGLDDELERLEKQQKTIDLKIEELKKQKSEDAKP